MRETTIACDFCVVGGGMAGLIAALSAARHGAKTVLIHDRPVLGGNASSEIRMHVCGAHGADKRETGILEELLLENHARNPLANYSIWDSVLYGAAVTQPGLELLLNTSVLACEAEGGAIRSVTGWQLTTETRWTVCAKVFADCSGDGILAPLSGALWQLGREAKATYGETIPPDTADRKTMGMSCLIQPREYPSAQPFTPPSWAHSYAANSEQVRSRGYDLWRTNFWWIEVGGDSEDILHYCEKAREDLVKIVFGTWDYIKNHAPDKEKYANWAIDWIGFLPGKRESRRYVGDHVLTQRDIEAEGRFDDLVAYGGWTMDDHFPAGFYYPKAGTIFHPAPSPFGIPYRSLYSKNIANLFCAGRCHSASHAALSATRVMGTTSLMGQAVGTAAAIAVRDGLTPRGVWERRLAELQHTLQEDDCWLPWRTRPVAALSRTARLTASAGDPEPLRNGIDRPVGGASNAWTAAFGESVAYLFDADTAVASVRLVFDSNLSRPGKNMRHLYPLNAPAWQTPASLLKAFRLETLDADGVWHTAIRVTDNTQRLVRLPLQAVCRGVRLVPEAAHGGEQARLFGFEVVSKQT